ncbi:beta-propeller domain-containing protein [Nocardioides cheoyonin]|uniref:beta-propeller domain-containing protein n=1 Tax=Nocardioides cheoyonin TaxID=3156615 RepID=UPI0032B31E15
MTDLERLWDDLPTSAPPVEAVLREGRRPEAPGPALRRRRLTRPLMVAGAAAAIGGAFVAGTLVADTGAPTSPGTSGRSAAGPALAAFQADLPAANSCRQLRAAYVDRALGEVTAWGWRGGSQPLGTSYVPLGGMLDVQSSRAATASPLETTRQTASSTGTNVQEQGVDEPDAVKTDGTTLVRLRGDELLVYDLSGTRVKRLGSVALPGLEDGELLLTGDTVVALGTDATAPRYPAADGPRRGTRVLTVSLSDPAEPTITDDVSYRSRLLSARQHGSTVRLVMSSGLPDLGFVTPGRGRTRKQALATNRRLVQDAPVTAWLPTYDTGAGAGQLLDCTNVAIPPDALGLDTVSVVGFDAATPTRPEAIGLAGATDVAYESGDDLYLAATPPAWQQWAGMSVCPTCLPATVPPSGGTTYLFDFALDGPHATHVASGEVEGTIADRWSMDSADGILRVAVGRSSETGNFNSIVTFRRQGTHLVPLGRIGHLGVGEDIKSVRWFDDLAILTTYRQIDPLYVVDLRDLRRPRLVDRLKVSGFSAYLHPLGGWRMIGVGEGSDRRLRSSAQIGLFDVRDLTHVRRMDVARFAPGSSAVAGQDPRAFTWLPGHRTVLTVVRHGRNGYLVTLWLHHGRLHVSRTLVEYGDDVASVRTIGLRDGRVVLVTGEAVRFFDLPPHR